MDDKNIDYIARHYQKDLFSSEKALKKLGIRNSSNWRRYGIAASVTAIILLTATATIFYKHKGKDIEPQEPQQIAVTNTISPLTQVKTIDFDNAPLTIVIERIEEVYGVRVVNTPEQSLEYTLSLHFEGNPTDLIDAINEILGTHMRVEQK